MPLNKIFSKKQFSEIEQPEINEQPQTMDNLMSIFNSLSNDQIQKWKDFYNSILNLKNSEQVQNNLNYKKVLHDTKMTLEFLDKKINIKKSQNNEMEDGAEKNNNKSENNENYERKKSQNQTLKMTNNNIDFSQMEMDQKEPQNVIQIISENSQHLKNKQNPKNP